MTQIGETIGERFVILGVLGRGGMATVYLATDNVREQNIALKVVHPHLARRASVRQRLRREVHAAAKLRHPRAIVAHELHEIDGGLALSMPLHRGRTLAEVVETHGPLSADALRTLAAQLTDVVAAAHQHGVLHRDISPNNVMIDENGDAALVDFGLARLDDVQTATATATLGTVGYSAPEIFDGVRADPRSDVYSLGAVLFFAATGQAPFAADGPMAALKKQLADERPALSALRRGLPRTMVATIEAMLSADLVHRPQGARIVADALAQNTPPTAIPEERVTSAPLESAPLALPPGRWSVVVQERPEDAVRRARLREAAEGSSRIEVVLFGLWKHAEMQLRSAFDLPKAVSPEGRLVRIVTDVAKQPASELSANEAILEERFCLVEGVDEASAAEIARRARRMGFEADAVEDAPLRDFRPLLAVLIGVPILPLAVLTFPSVFFPLFYVALMMLVQLSWRHTQAEAHQPSLPVVFTQSPTPVISDTEAVPVVIEGPVGAVLRRTARELSLLEETLSGSDLTVSSAAARDINDTLKELRGKVAGLSAEARRLQADLSDGDADAAAIAAAKVEDRLIRLETFARSGQQGMATERAELQRALRAHQADQIAREAAEAGLTQIAARLLEIGAAAAQSRRALSSTTSDAAEVEEMVFRLRAETRAAEAAQAEMDDALKRRRAAQSKQRQP